ncbi:hypothetical protein [Labrys neptuniae]
MRRLIAMGTLVPCLAMMLSACTITGDGIGPVLSMGSSEQSFIDRYGKPDYRSQDGSSVRLVYLGNRLPFRQHGDTPPLSQPEQRRILAQYGLAFDRSCAVLVSLIFGRVIGMTSAGGRC